MSRKYVDYSKYPKCMWKGMSQAQQEAAFSVGVTWNSESTEIKSWFGDIGYNPEHGVLTCGWHGDDGESTTIEEWLEWIKTQGTPEEDPVQEFVNKHFSSGIFTTAYEFRRAVLAIIREYEEGR